MHSEGLRDRILHELRTMPSRNFRGGKASEMEKKVYKSMVSDRKKKYNIDDVLEQLEELPNIYKKNYKPKNDELMDYLKLGKKDLRKTSSDKKPKKPNKASKSTSPIKGATSHNLAAYYVSERYDIVFNR